MLRQEYIIQENADKTRITLHYRFKWIIFLLYVLVSAYIIGQSITSPVNPSWRWLFVGLMGIAFVLIVLQLIFVLSPEIITIANGRMMVEHRVGPIVGRHESYQISEINNMRIALTPQQRKNGLSCIREIIFSYHGKDVRLGRDLSEDVASKLIDGPFKQMVNSG
jgi:hypothetical protein